MNRPIVASASDSVMSPLGTSILNRTSSAKSALAAVNPRVVRASRNAAPTSRASITLAGRGRSHRHQAVRLAVHCVRGVGVRRLDQAEDLAALLVHPVVEIAHAVAFLNLQVRGVGSRDVGRGGTVGEAVVHVHVQSHPFSPPSGAYGRKTTVPRPFRRVAWSGPGLPRTISLRCPR